MQEKELRLLFNAGCFKLCRAVPIAMSKGWNLKFVTNDDRDEVLTLQRNQSEREFKSLDGAVSVAKKVGFDWVRVEIGNLHWEEKL